MSDIFISYASQDRDKIKLLVDKLAATGGWSVWWDRNIPFGKTFDKVIEKELTTARCVVVVWSNQSIKSDWVIEEAQYGRERQILVPVLIDNVPIPFGFRRIQAANLVDWDGTERYPVFQKLVDDIVHILLKSSPALEKEQSPTSNEMAGEQPTVAPSSTLVEVPPLGEREDHKEEGDGEHTEETRESVALSRWRRLLLAGLAVVAMAVVAYALVPRTPEPPTERPVVVHPRTPDPPVTWPPPDDRVAQAVGRCKATWKSRESKLASDPGNAKTLDAQADCGMVLLENVRLTGNEVRFRDVADPITPVLYQALETARGARAADLLAHLGMADFLRSRDGVGGLRPDSFYRRAIEQDPDNPYANAMWGHWILWQHGSLAEALARFHRALSSGREREYVRSLQIAALMNFSDAPLEFEAVRVANEMRGNGEPVPTNDAERGFWSGYWNLYYSQLLSGTQKEKEAFLAILPPAEHLATFRWLFPESQMPPDKLNLWVLFLATFQELNGERLAARSNYESLRSELLSQHASGRLLDRTEEGLRRLSGTQ